MKLRRMEIWWVNFTGKDYLIQGVHPAVIIKEWRGLTKVGKGIENIEVLPLTSKPPKKTLQTQVFIKDYKKYGLDKPSYVMCEQIRQISVKDLNINKNKNFLGELKPIGSFNKAIENEINNKLARQLQLDHRYPEFDEEDFDFEKAESFESELYLKLSHKFIDCFNKNKYNKALYICENKILKEVNTFGYNRNKYLHKTYYNIGLCYLKLKDYDNCNKNATKSLTYLNSNKITEEYANSMFLIIRCSNDSYFKYKTYSKLSKYYRLTDNINMKSLCIFNMCMLKNKRELCEKIYSLNRQHLNKMVINSMRMALGKT